MNDNPIIFSSTFSITAGNVVPDLGALQPTNRVPMYIDEIRFTSILANPGAFPWPSAGLISSGLMAKFSLGRLAMTASHNSNNIKSDFVPVWLFGGDRQDTIAQARGTGSAVFSWKLPKPLYVPAGMVLASEFRLSDLFTAGTSFEVSYIGRVTNDPLPPLVAVPYVTAFRVTSNTPGVQSSSERALGNPFSVPINVQRLVGRIAAFNDPVWLEPVPPRPLDIDLWLTRGTKKYQLVRHLRTGVDLSGTAYGNWGDVFDLETRTADITDLVLDPRDWLSTTIDMHASAMTVTYGVNPALFYPAVSMVGYREETL